MVSVNQFMDAKGEIKQKLITKIVRIYDIAIRKKIDGQVGGWEFMEKKNPIEKWIIWFLMREVVNSEYRNSFYQK